MSAGYLDRRHLLGVVAGSERFGDRLGAHVAAGDRPPVVFLREEGADEADDRGPVGEDPDDIGAPAGLLIEPLERVCCSTAAASAPSESR
jgi:hypothetical protein